MQDPGFSTRQGRTTLILKEGHFKRHHKHTVTMATSEISLHKKNQLELSQEGQTPPTLLDAV